MWRDMGEGEALVGVGGGAGIEQWREEGRTIVCGGYWYGGMVVAHDGKSGAGVAAPTLLIIVEVDGA